MQMPDSAQRFLEQTGIQDRSWTPGNLGQGTAAGAITDFKTMLETRIARWRDMQGAIDVDAQTSGSLNRVAAQRLAQDRAVGAELSTWIGQVEQHSAKLTTQDRDRIIRVGMDSRTSVSDDAARLLSELRARA